MKRGKGLSPVVATTLLVAMVVIIALIIFFWFRGMTEETITKFDGENVKMVCNDVYFEASYSGNTLYVSNSGNVPIFDMEMRVYGDGSHSTEDLRETYSTTWPEAGLNQGGTFTDVVSVTGNSIVLVPVLMGDSNSGRKTYVCDEKQHGVSVSV
jgi:FlaG/FlaF family flagellin (archaellin)